MKSKLDIGRGLHSFWSWRRGCYWSDMELLVSHELRAGVHLKMQYGRRYLFCRS